MRDNGGGVLRRVDWGAMDKVRFGRALGYGARHAAKSLLAAADAATSPDPKAGAPGGTRPAATQSQAAAQSQAAPRGEVQRPVARTAAPQRAAQVLSAGRKASKGVFAPVKQATSVVMLQVTGSFFGLLAFAMGRGLWKLKDGFRAPVFSQLWVEAWVVSAMTAVLVYFTISNFVRAAKRERGA